MAIDLRGLKAVCVQGDGPEEAFHFSTGDGLFWSVVLLICVWGFQRATR
jgi:hypothetical protein